MNFEQALKSFIAGRIGRIPPLADEHQFVGDALRFTYGEKSLGATEVSPEAQSVFDRPDLKEEGFEFIGSGKHGFVIGNRKTVVKIGEDYQSYGSLGPNAIPPGLAAEVRGEGKCNGVPYLICERLNIEQPCLLEEMIAHLFKGRELGVIYGDAKPENYGHDAQGNFKALDLAHFAPLDGAAKFSFVIQGLLLADINRRKYPFLFSDTKNTYLVTEKIYNPYRVPSSITNTSEWRKKFNAVLGAVGIDTEKVEFVENTQIIRIPATHVTYGQPPHEEPLADYISRSLGVAASPVQPGTGIDATPGR